MSYTCSPSKLTHTFPRRPILLMYILEDGLLVDTGQTSGIIMAGMPSEKVYGLTEKGREFINKWLSAEELD